MRAGQGWSLILSDNPLNVPLQKNGYPMRFSLLSTLRMVCLVVYFAALASPSVSQECESYGLPPLLKQGINVSSWLEDINAASPPMQPLKALKDRGISTVRLPVNGTLLMPHFTDAVTVAAVWQKLDSALEQLNEAGFVVMLDMHPDRQFALLHQQHPPQAFTLLKNLWLEIAVRYAHYPEAGLVFELLNEPVIASATWRTQAQELVYVLRPHAPKRWFVVGSGDAQRIDALYPWEPLDDPKTIYAVHFYDPMVFTHQGLSWDPSDPLRLLQGVPFPVDVQNPRMEAVLENLERAGHAHYANELRAGLVQSWSEDNIRAEFDLLSQWQQRHGKPVIVNEFGVLRYHALPADRIRWHKTVVEQARRICAGWTLWDYHQGFGIIEPSGALDDDMVRALFQNSGFD